MICIGVMIQQQNHIRNKNLGYNQEQIAIIRVDPWSAKFYKRGSVKFYKQEILKDPRIAGATISDRTLTTSGGYSWANYSLPDGAKIKINLIGIDADYLPTLEILLLEGRNFSEDHPSDRERAVLINETLAKQLNIEDPVGKILSGTERLKDPCHHWCGTRFPHQVPVPNYRATGVADGKIQQSPVLTRPYSSGPYARNDRYAQKNLEYHCTECALSIVVSRRQSEPTISR